jgi:hypothetical protein
MSASRPPVMPFGTCIALAVAVLLAVGCGSRAPAPGSHPASSAVPSMSCRQQVQTWKQGPARAAFSRLKAALKQAQAAEKTGDVTGMQSAMKQLVPAAYALAGHPMPHCADPDSLYPTFATKIFTAGGKARSAHGLGALMRAAAPLPGVKKAERQMTAEIDRTVGQNQ